MGCSAGSGSGDTDAPTTGADASSSTGAGSTGSSSTGASSTGSSGGETGDTGGPTDDPDPVPPEFTVCEGGPTGTEFSVTPDDYLDLVEGMQPGDALRFTPGTYTGGLTIADKNGGPGACFFFLGPEDGPAAVFTGSDSRNTVSISDASYVVIRGLELDGGGLVGDAVKAEGSATHAHHVVLEDLDIHDHDANQQIVGINTKCTTWNWVIRRIRIERAGTGMYLGNSDGSAPFVNGLIEHNVVLDTTGYNIQIKHQLDRPELEGLPVAGSTIVRHNVWSKQIGGDPADPRPNLLLGHFPPSGPGSDDQYLVYGNLFHDNPHEALVQMEGNVAFYANVLINPHGPGLHVQPHNDVPKRIDVFGNTVVTSSEGITVTGGDPAHAQNVAGNAVFADPAIVGGTQADNHLDPPPEAASVLVDASSLLGGGFDAHPRPGELDDRFTLAAFSAYPGFDRDFDGRPRDGTFRGAYEGPAGAGAWGLDRDFKP